MTYRIEVLVLGKWLVSSRGVSPVEADALRRARGTDPTVRLVPELNK